MLSKKMVVSLSLFLSLITGVLKADDCDDIALLTDYGVIGENSF